MATTASLEFALRHPVVIARVLLGASIVALAACGTNPYSLPKIESGEPSYEDTSPPEAPEPAPTPAPDSSTGSGGHNVLIDRAVQARSSGDADRALGYLQRAQRIDPDDAEIYLELARTHAVLGNTAQAKAVAERGLLYCSGSRQCNALAGFVD
ncbi:hypothetical protein BST95_01025 [Halioglobus japonicus]|uniref:Tetratricopeptide repeat-containing protein n=1 Tax=Halioglobus japonicus TaxID=930805 RepID=A0AAP8MC54_9GAMM|nr:tetratricopeptide repeat protein [Halioglobus japonicus]AQA17005.1 hypothetical protein BST95_01025 [Halioglobus japonicus]PLW84909.1 tetratricopeptide repeat-containing protein [Halioglobus japonicus]